MSASSGGSLVSCISAFPQLRVELFTRADNGCPAPSPRRALRGFARELQSDRFVPPRCLRLTLSAPGNSVAPRQLRQRHGHRDQGDGTASQCTESEAAPCYQRPHTSPANTASPRRVCRHIPPPPWRHLPEPTNPLRAAFRQQGDLQETDHPLPSGLGRPSVAAFAEKYGTT